MRTCTILLRAISQEMLQIQCTYPWYEFENNIRLHPHLPVSNELIHIRTICDQEIKKKTPHISPSQASYGIPYVTILAKSDCSYNRTTRYIMLTHYTRSNHVRSQWLYHLVTSVYYKLKNEIHSNTVHQFVENMYNVDTYENIYIQYMWNRHYKGGYWFDQWSFM